MLDLLNRKITIHRHKICRIVKRVKTISAELTKSPKLMEAANISHLLDLIDELESTLIRVTTNRNDKETCRYDKFRPRKVY
jgi:hypothetical protein